MAEDGCGAQFRAAVQVIQGLPRSGSYRPSYEEMLRFYSFYKQATAGFCQGPRPGFWDPIGRYKWDAWHSLGRMSKEEAMAAYVAEMKKVAQKIIDTVPMDETTEEMFSYFEPLYEVIHDMPRPPESFFKRKGGSREQTAQPSQDDVAKSSQDDAGSNPVLLCPEDSVPGQQQDGPGGGLAPAVEGGLVTSDSEGDLYCDTLEQMEPQQAGQLLGLSTNGTGCARPEPPRPHGTGQGEQDEGRRGEGQSSAGPPTLGSLTDLQLPGTEQDAGSTPELLAELDAHVAGTIQALQDNMRWVLERLSELETLTSAQEDTAETGTGQPLTPQAVTPWPLTISPRTLFFLIAWPFVTQWLLRRWQGGKR